MGLCVVLRGQAMSHELLQISFDEDVVPMIFEILLEYLGIIQGRILCWRSPLTLFQSPEVLTTTLEENSGFFRIAFNIVEIHFVTSSSSQLLPSLPR